MRNARFLKAASVLALLVALLSYSYDFECLLESQGCQQQGIVVQAELDSVCAQPSLMPMVAALLPTFMGISVPAPTLVSPAPRLWVSLQPPSQPPLSVPLGLRAPPAVA